MRDILISMVCIMVHLCCFGASCSVCGTTMGLREHGSYHYCYKHYCKKHKMPLLDGRCGVCALQRDIENKKAKCFACDAKKDIIMVNNAGGVSYTRFGASTSGGGIYCAACPKHCCKKHRLVLTPCGAYGDKNLYCAQCLEEQKKEQIKERQELTKQVEVLKQKEIEAKNSLLAQPLESLFGVKLGGMASQYVEFKGGKDIYPFTPSKKFRDFNKYYFLVSNGKVVQIVAEQRFKNFSDAKRELDNVIDILDLKYNKLRRSEFIEDHIWEKHCFYAFEQYDEEEKPKQFIRVGYDQVKEAIFEYKVVIVASLTDGVKKYVDDNRVKDADAL